MTLGVRTVLDWTAELRRIIPTPCYERPLVCRGLPSDSVAIVIGENPATHMNVDWWTFWSGVRGFDLDRFVDHYCKERIALRKRISNTRVTLPQSMYQGE